MLEDMPKHNPEHDTHNLEDSLEERIEEGIKHAGNDTKNLVIDNLVHPWKESAAFFMDMAKNFWGVIKEQYCSIPAILNPEKRAGRKISRARSKILKTRYQEQVRLTIKEKHDLPGWMAYTLSKFSVPPSKNEESKRFRTQILSHLFGGLPKRYRGIIAEMDGGGTNPDTLAKNNVYLEFFVTPLSILYLTLGNQGVEYAAQQTSTQPPAYLETLVTAGIVYKAIQPVIRMTYNKVTGKHLPNLASMYAEIFPMNILIIALYVGDIGLKIKERFSKTKKDTNILTDTHHVPSESAPSRIREDIKEIKKIEEIKKPTHGIYGA